MCEGIRVDRVRGGVVVGGELGCGFGKKWRRLQGTSV